MNDNLNGAIERARHAQEIEIIYLQSHLQLGSGLITGIVLAVITAAKGLAEVVLGQQPTVETVSVCVNAQMNVKRVVDNIMSRGALNSPTTSAL